MTEMEHQKSAEQLYSSLRSHFAKIEQSATWSPHEARKMGIKLVRETMQAQDAKTRAETLREAEEALHAWGANDPSVREGLDIAIAEVAALIKEPHTP